MRIPYPMVTWDVLDQWLEGGADLVLVDLRTGPEYEASHLRGAVNLPFGELPARYRQLPRDKFLVFYCSHGAQSMRACNWLERMGFSVANLAGGLSYYRGKFLEPGGESYGNVDRNGRQDLQW